MKKDYINMPEIIIDALNRMDEDLVAHCERVAYMIMNYMEKDGSFSNDEICRFIWTTLFHDIGLFHKVDNESWDDTEKESKFSHSEYGYLFLKEFSPYPEYTKMVRYHHASWKEIEKTKELSDKLKSIVKIIKVLDQIDLYAMKCRQSGIKEDFDIVYEMANGHLTKETCDIIKEILIESNLSDHSKIHESIISKLKELKASKKEKEAMLRTLINAIDFRSRYTAIHCSIMVKVSDKIGELVGLDDNEKEKLHIGAMLHDLGKISIPLEILESNGKLEGEDWEIMKSHVNITEEMLKNRVNDDILKIAIRHHETLDGMGYPYNLKAEDINETQRITTIADIISALSEERSYKKAFPPDKILKILEEMSDKNKISKEILDTVEKNSSIIFETAKEANKTAVAAYDNMMEEYSLRKSTN